MTTTLEYIREGLANGQQVFRRSVLEKLIEELDLNPTSTADGTKPVNQAVYDHKITELTVMLRDTERRLSEAERNLNIEKKRVFDLQRKSRQTSTY